MNSLDLSNRDAINWLRAAWQGSTLLGVAMIGLVWGSLSLLLETERSTAERAAIQSSDNLVRAFEGHLLRSIQDIERLLMLLRRNYALDPDGFNFTSWAAANALSDNQVMQFGIIGPDGILKLSSMGSRSEYRIDLSDREHFLALANAKTDGLFIGKPVIGRMSGKATIQLARRIENPDGSFGGVITASVDPNYFARFYDTFNIGANSYVRIVGTDGVVRAVGGRTVETPGRNISGAALFKHYKQQPSGWFYTSSSLTDNITRLLTYRTVSNYPLIVTTGISASEIFAAVHNKQRAYQIVATILTLLILITIGFSIQERATLQRVTDLAQTQNQRFDMAIRSMSQGLCIFDAKMRLVVHNDGYANMYRLPPELLEVGTPYDAIVAHCVRQGLLKGGTDDIAVRERLAAMSSLPSDARTSRIEELANGQVIRVVRDPIKGGGWVATQEDITERKIAEQELDRAKKFLNSIIENVPIAVLVREPRELRYVLVNRVAEQLFGLSREALLGKTAADIFSKERADLIASHDAISMQSKDAPLTVVDHSIQRPDGTKRVVSTKRLTVRDHNESPQWLIAVIEDVTEKKQAEAKIAYLAHHDPLTGLPNRAQFSERLDKAIASVGHGAQLAVLFLDLDHFKQVNDTLGHLFGDELLISVAERLRGCIGESDTVARLGGDEFAIIQTSLENPTDVANLAGRIQAAVKAPYDLGALSAVIDVSIGISLSPRDSTDPAELMKRADMAVYKAKADGRGTYRFFEPEMDTLMKARRKLEIDLRNAIIKGGLTLFYQPIVNLENDEIIGLEALLHWRHPERGVITPSEFIPVAEETGLIVPLGEWVLRQACSDAANWPSDIKIAVNLSPAQFQSDNLVQVIINALAASGVSPSRLELEVTEALLLQDNERNITVLNKLSDLGVQIAMDDFGTGYSSLSYLQRFPFHKIKIDRSFIANLKDEDDVAFAIVQAVATLATALGVTTTAEGIETQRQLELVKAAGCNTMQGYFFSRPKPAAEIAELFLSHDAKAASAA